MRTNGTQARKELVATTALQGTDEPSEKQGAPGPGGVLGLEVHVFNKAALSCPFQPQNGPILPSGSATWVIQPVKTLLLWVFSLQPESQMQPRKARHDRVKRPQNTDVLKEDSPFRRQEINPAFTAPSKPFLQGTRREGATPARWQNPKSPKNSRFNEFLRSQLLTEKETCSPNRDPPPKDLTASWAGVLAARKYSGSESPS